MGPLERLLVPGPDPEAALAEVVGGAVWDRPGMLTRHRPSITLPALGVPLLPFLQAAQAGFGPTNLLS